MQNKDTASIFSGATPDIVKEDLKPLVIFQEEGISIEKPTTSHEYTIEILKDKVSFYPMYLEDPRLSDRREHHAER